jgi:hypothetical protein
MKMKRREAKALGLEKYNTGKPCRNGHLADRYTCNGVCLECYKDTVQRNIVNKRKSAKKYYETHKKEESIKSKERYQRKKSIFSSI